MPEETKPKLTPQQVKLHLAQRFTMPDCCPVCGEINGDEVTHTHDEIEQRCLEDVQMTQTVHCSCGASWTDSYKLVGIDIADYGDRADAPEEIRLEQVLRAWKKLAELEYIAGTPSAGTEDMEGASQARIEARRLHEAYFGKESDDAH